MIFSFSLRSVPERFFPPHAYLSVCPVIAETFFRECSRSIVRLRRRWSVSESRKVNPAALSLSCFPAGTSGERRRCSIPVRPLPCSNGGGIRYPDLVSPSPCFPPVGTSRSISFRDRGETCAECHGAVLPADGFSNSMYRDEIPKSSFLSILPAVLNAIFVGFSSRYFSWRAHSLPTPAPSLFAWNMCLPGTPSSLPGSLSYGPSARRLTCLLQLLHLSSFFREDCCEFLRAPPLHVTRPGFKEIALRRYYPVECRVYFSAMAIALSM